MGKLTSLIIGTIVAGAFSFYVLSTGYAAIINWIGPLFGVELVLVLGYLYMFFGNPWSYPLLIVAWIVVGFSVAVGSRRALKSAGAAVSVFFLSLLFFVILAIGFFLFLLSSGQTSSITGGFGIASFPPPPPGSSLAQILSAPIISSFISFLEPLFSGVGTPGVSFPGGPLSILSPFILAFVVNLIIVTVSAALFGLLFSMIAGGKIRFLGTGMAKRALVVALVTGLVASGLAYGLTNSGSGSTVSSQPIQASTGTDLSVLAQAYESAYPSLAGGSQQTDLSLPYNLSALLSPFIQSDPSGYLEGIGSYVSSSGSVYNGYGYAVMGNSTPSAEFFNAPHMTDSIATLMVGVSNLSNFFVDLSGLNVSVPAVSTTEYLNLVPSVMLIQLYPGSTNQSRSMASSDLSYIESSSGLSFTKVLSLPITANATSGQMISVYLYTSGASYTDFAGGFYNSTVSGFYSDGLVKVFQEKLASGQLSTGAGAVDGSMLFSAFINIDLLNETSFSTSSLNSVLNYSKYVSVVAGATVDNYRFHSYLAYRNISLAETLGYDSPIYFSSSSTGSLLVFGVPTTSETNSTLVRGVNFTAFIRGFNLTTIGNTPIEVQSLGVYDETTGIAPSTTTMSTNWTFPAHLDVNIVSHFVSGGYVEVNTTISNNDTVPIYNLTLDESYITHYYGSDLANITGSPVIKVGTLPQGFTLVNTFEFHPRGVGKYVIWNITEQYSYPVTSGNSTKSITMQIQPFTVYVAPPFFINAFNGAIYRSLDSIGHAVHFPYLTIQLLPQFYLFDLIVLLIVALDIYIEYRAYRKGKKAKTT